MKDYLPVGSKKVSFRRGRCLILDKVRQFLQHINVSDVYLCSLGVTESPRRKLLALAAGYYKTANWPRVMNNDYLV